jgi:tetratricopeptide (TPR) repeat protein
MTSPQRPRALQFGLSVITLALVAACVQTPDTKNATPADGGPTAPAGGGSTDAPAPATAPGTTAGPAAPAQPLTPQETQRSITIAVEFLEAGQEELAEAELKKVLQSDPNQRLANSLMRQIKDDPISILGRESFAYRVQPGESLSSIAKRFINNDPYSFYALARYNKITVPKSLAGGQVIRVPGRGPALQAPAAPPVPPPPVVATTPPLPQPPPPTAPAVVQAPSDVDKLQAEVAAKRKREESIANFTKAARAAMAKQDLDGSIRNWDSVLKIDPDNNNAQLERRRAIDLKRRLEDKKLQPVK